MIENSDRPLAGIVLRLLSGLLFAGMLVCVKWVSDEVPLGQVVFFRSAFALLPIVIFLAWRREFPAALATRRPGGHLLRSGMGAAAMFASFAAVARLPVAEATLLAQLAPVLMALGGVLILGERFTPLRAVALGLAVCGVAVLADLLLFRLPISTGFLVALPFVLGAAALAALEGRRLRWPLRR